MPRVTDPMRRNSGDRWLIWSDQGEHRRRCRPSSNRPPRRSGIGCHRPIAMNAADRTAPTSAERDELTRLRRENRQLRQERDILGKIRR
jgi:transposase-like protein